MTSTLDRAHGALLGLAVGDALGMPTQSLSRARIAEQYGPITGLRASAADQPIAPDMAAGRITDDTEQAVLIGELLIAGEGHLDPEAVARTLLDWERSMIERGSLDLLGPSTKAALTALQSGVPAEQAGSNGTTNGAAMRITPVGIAVAPGPQLLDAVVEASLVTHHTGLAISGAAAVAAAVSAGVAGADVDAALDLAVEVAVAGEQRGRWIAGASIPTRFRVLRPLARAADDLDFADLLVDVVGTSVQSQESVVSALLIADRYRDDPFAGLCLAASLGGDTDTVAAMAGAVLGACHGPAVFPEPVRETVRTVNRLDLLPLAEHLLALRR